MRGESKGEIPRKKKPLYRVIDSKGENETCYSLLLELAYSLTILLQASANGLHQAKTVFYRLDSSFTPSHRPFFSPSSVVSAPFSVSALRGEKKTNVDGL